MPVTATHLLTAASGTDATSYETASITPSGGTRLYLAWFSWAQTTPGTASASGNSLTWTAVDSVTQGSRKGTLFRALGAGSAGTITFSVAGGTGTPSRAGWSINEFNNIDLTGTNGDAAIVQAVTNSSASATGLSITMAAFGSADNATFGAIGVDADGAISHEVGFTELGEANTGGEGFAVETEFRADNDTEINWTHPDTTSNWGIGVELKFVQAPAEVGNNRGYSFIV